MARGRNKGMNSNDVTEAMGIQIPDVTKEIYPPGVPTQDDGSVADEAELSVDEARKIGALTKESAQFNRKQAKNTHLRQQGVTGVKWGEKDALQLFEMLKMTWGSSALSVYVTRQEPHPPIVFKPFSTGPIKDAQAFYEYIERNIHKNSPEAHYEIRFRDGGGERARGDIRMPDATTNETAKNQDPQHFGHPNGFPYPWMAGQPMPFNQMSGPPHPYYNNPAMYGGHPPPWEVQAQQQAPAPVQAAPQQAQPIVVPLSVPMAPQQQPQPQYPQQQATLPPGLDPNMVAIMTSLHQNMQLTQDLIRQNQQSQLQMEHAMGTVEEFKRQIASGTFHIPSANPQQVQHTQPQQQNHASVQPNMPPGMMGAPPQQYYAGQQYPGQSFNGMPMQQQYPHPQFHQQPTAPPPPPVDPLTMLNRTIESFVGVSQAMDKARNAIAPVQAPEPQELMMPAGAAAAVDQNQPFATMPIGFGEKPPVLAYNPKDGSINMVGTLLGNAEKIVGFMQGLGTTFVEMQKAQLAQSGSVLVESTRGVPQSTPALPQTSNLVPNVDFSKMMGVP